MFVKEDVHGDTALDKAEGGNRQTCTQLLLDYFARSNGLVVRLFYILGIITKCSFVAYSKV